MFIWIYGCVYEEHKYPDSALRSNSSIPESEVDDQDDVAQPVVVVRAQEVAAHTRDHTQQQLQHIQRREHMVRHRHYYTEHYLMTQQHVNPFPRLTRSCTT